MSKDRKSPVAVLTASAAVYCLWVAYQSWQAHLTLGESHGPFGFVSVAAFVFGSVLVLLTAWLFAGATSSGR